MTLKDVQFYFLNNSKDENEIELIDSDFTISYYINPIQISKAVYIAQRHLKIYDGSDMSSYFCVGAINVLNTYLSRNLDVVKNLYLYIYHTGKHVRMSIEDRIKFHHCYFLYEYNIGGYYKELLNYHQKFKIFE